VRGFTRLTIRETLALCAFEGHRRTFPVCHFAGVPFEIPFREVAREMSFADRMVRAEHRALHDTETTLGSVDMHKTAKTDIFVSAVIYCAVS
jgi:hypothetical protein